MIFLSPCRFQSTFPRGERHLCWLVAVKHIHFNPRSLVGNDYIPVGTYTIVEISIHVPSWGTTIFTRRQPPCILFQSTFPRGERQNEPVNLKQIDNFNPRSLVGNDHLLHHCPENIVNFNPRSLVGNDARSGDTVKFIFYFNPRSLVGNDFLSGPGPPDRRISIHVPSWGTTPFVDNLTWLIDISIHVPSWGTTRQ